MCSLVVPVYQSLPVQARTFSQGKTEDNYTYLSTVRYPITTLLVSHGVQGQSAIGANLREWTRRKGGKRKWQAVSWYREKNLQETDQKNAMPSQNILRYKRKARKETRTRMSGHKR